jgi:transcriptional regulator with XRE-family HTH domain
MEEEAPDQKRGSLFGQLLAERRAKAGISLLELSALTGMPLSLLEAYEEGRELPSFDTCYKLAQAINSRLRQSFMIQDFWQAASMDRAALVSRAADTGRLRRKLLSETKSRMG